MNDAIRDEDFPQTPDGVKKLLLDEDRLRAFRDGDAWVWAQFLRLTIGLLMRYATKRCGGSFTGNDIEDVVQKTYLNAYEKRNELDPTRNVMGWLCTVCLNEIRGHVRWMGVADRDWSSLNVSVAGTDAESTATMADTIADHREPPPDAVPSESPAERVERLLARLTPEERAIMKRYHIDGVDAKTLAAERGVTVGAMRARIHVIHEKLRSQPPPGDD